jgi:2-polyprenyl-3-methyl-5-hydroxy-6-metoxy-1,4-benzoquinol methylase
MKPSDYYANPRAELVAELAPPLGAVLDIGCGEGAAAPNLRAAGATHIAGIELDKAAAERAREVYDEVAAGAVEDLLATLAGPFDTVLCYDVLEHLVDPGAVLRALHEVAAPAARVHVSVPNARHYSLVRDLLFRGTFGYTDWGHRDRTHLRWFTRRDIVALLDGCGWQVERASHPSLVGVRGAIHRLAAGRIAEFTMVQWSVLARRAS